MGGFTYNFREIADNMLVVRKQSFLVTPTNLLLASLKLRPSD
jgi:hypothetical protein